MRDPFADDIEDEAQTVSEAPKSDPWQEETPKVENSPQRPVQTVSEGKVVVTLKGGTGYDAPWVVIHADTPAEALDLLSGEEAKTTAELLKKTAAVAKFFHGQVGGSSGNGGGQSRGGGRPGEPKEAKQAPNGEDRYCKHGQMKWNSGFKNGKAWGGWFCPEPRDSDDKCDPQWPSRR